MFVLPTSIARSMSGGPEAYAGSRAGSLLHAHGADDVALGHGAPVPVGAADPRVLPVEVRRPGEGHEELARARVPPREGHADVEGIEGDGRGLAAQQGAGAAVAVAPAVAELRDEPRDHAVDGEARVEA